MYQDVKAQIATLCQSLGRDEPTLVAVSKVQPLANIEDVLKAGHRIYGENRVQEALSKWPSFTKNYHGIELHLLGPLQSNKVKDAVELFDVIHSLDRLKLAEKFAEFAQKRGRSPQFFIQINTGDEPQKAGISIHELGMFLSEIKGYELPILGLMCIPPVGDDPRLHFRKLRELAEFHGLKGLSMGMSGDYKIAIEEGATHVRVGSAIFGARDYS